jgi:hypothetical protein
MARPPSDLVKVRPIRDEDGLSPYQTYIAYRIANHLGERKYEIQDHPHLCSCGCKMDFGGYWADWFEEVN